VELRPTAARDLESLHRLFLESISAVYRPHAFEPPAPPLEVFANQQRHILETGRSVVALESDAIRGFASAWARGDDWFLASLFIASDAQSRGLGSQLLDAVWGEQSRRRTITDSIQPVSNALYARCGLVPATPVLSFSGRPRARSGVETAPVDLVEIDRAAYGFDRSVDHAYWSRFARLTTWPRAYAYSFPGGAIGPVAGADADAAAAALEAELARADGEVALRIPGSSRQLVGVALAAGLRLAPVPGLLLLSDGVAPPTALAIGSYTLY